MEPYALFLFTGLLPWLFFSGALMDAAVTLVDNGQLMAKVVCPPEIFPAVTVISHLIHHLLAFPVLLLALTASHFLDWHAFPKWIVILPIVLVPWILTVTGLAFAVSALAVYFRDLRDLLGHLLNLLFFSSPIIYSLASLPHEWLAGILKLNPLASLIDLYRSAVFVGELAPLSVWAVSTLVGLLSCWLGAWVFSRLRDSLVESV
jgi:ABC-type polysaccharide/polyol phosphate export permease